MDPDLVAPLVALLGFGTFSLIGLRMYLSYRTRRFELTSGAVAPRLEELIEDLRQEVQALRGDVGELHERVDFAERLLAKGKE